MVFVALSVIGIRWGQVESVTNPCEVILKISAQYPSTLPLVMLFVLFNKRKKIKPLLGTDIYCSTMTN